MTGTSEQNRQSGTAVEFCGPQVFLDFLEDLPPLLYADEEEEAFCMPHSLSH